MTPAEVRAEYAALPAIPDPPGERTWYQRLNTFDRFMTSGQFEADYFRMMGGRYGKAECDGFREEAPELFDLLLRAFPARS